MQTLFAYRQSCEANFELAIDRIAETFSPDLNSMEVQDKAQLKLEKEKATKLFRENHKNQSFKPSSDSKIDTVVTKCIKEYHSRNKSDQEHFKKLMVSEAEKITDRYLLILLLLSEFATLAENDAKLDHSKFVKNLLIKAIRFNKSIETISLRRNLNWTNESDVVRQWFRDFIKADDEYKNYLNSEVNSFDADQALVLHLVKNIIFKKDLIEIYMEEKDLSWDEDRAIVKSLATKTLKSLTENDGEDFELQELSYNWEEDKTFFQMLFDETVAVQKEYNSLIAEKTKNWDVDRIAATDKIILEMAIAEMINFPSIPVKVTINEYIEVAKRYSTPKSKVFINGILDVIASELENQGVVKKSGRGLIDNK